MSSAETPTVRRLDPSALPGIVIIEFNRPQVRNALGPADLLLVNRHLLDCQYDPAVKAIILTGAGGAFCSGVDLKALNALPADERANSLDTATELMVRIVTTPKVVVAAVNGASAGLGNHIALCSDLCIATQEASFHFTGALKGIPSMQLGALLLPAIIGLKRAKALLLRGGRLTAERAEELGICNAVVAADAWDAEIARLGAELAERDGATMSLNKFQMNQQAFQLIGALKLSSLAGGAQLAMAGALVTGRVAAGERR